MKTIMKLYIISLFLCLGITNSYGQKEKYKDKLMQVKKEYLTNKLNLEPEKGNDFWQQYNELHSKKEEVWSQLKKLAIKNRTNKPNDTEAIEVLKEIQKIKQKEASLEKEYWQKYIKIIGAAKVLELYFAEQDFKEEVIKKMNRQKTAHQK